MKLGYNFTLEQSQKLIMTPELRQAIEILQFNSMELKEYIFNELEENPMLDPEDSIDQSVKEDEIDWGKYLESQINSSNYNGKIDRNSKDYNYEAFVSDTISLNEHLMHQLDLSKISDEEYEVGKTLIESIDYNGYLKSTLDEIRKKQNTTIDKVEKILEIIQGFEPLGVGGRDLKECLLIQVREDKKAKSYITDIINEYLEDLGHNRIQKIAKQLNISIEEVQKAGDYIKNLEPKPGRSFSGNMNEVKYLTPDAELQLISGEFKVILKDIAGPRLNINNYYKRIMKTSSDDNTVEYLNERFNRAIWVIRSIEQRRKTIEKVINSIVKFQREFFIKGEKFLKPLTLKEVAEDIEMHESTVSRTTNGKYVQTPKGLFELKYFFSSGFLGKDGDMSSTSIKLILKEIIDNEDIKKPYSDQKIADKLKLKEINISRRTVAKYRYELDISSSSKRRRY